MRITDTKLWHLMSVANDLPERDCHEMVLMGFEPDLDALVVRRFDERGVKFTILDDADKPAVCFGISELGVPGVGVLWMLRGKRAGTFAKSAKRIIGQIVGAKQYRRIETYVKSDCERCIRLTTWLGFEFEGTKRAFFMDGSDADMFSIIDRSIAQ